MRLRELRATRYRSGSAMARELGWQQTRVSKLELGTQLPSEADLDAWIEAVGAGERERAELTDLLARARIEYSSWADLYRTGSISARQAEIGRWEAEAPIIREYQPAMMPGIVQTVPYAREMLSVPGGTTLTGSTPEQIESLIVERMKRQELLYEPGRQVRIVLGEAALRTWFGTIDALVGQLDRLITLSGLASVDLAILPVSASSPIMPLAGFSVHGDDTLYVETLTGEQRITNPEEVEAHIRAFEIAHESASQGQEAVALIQRVAAELRI